MGEGLERFRSECYHASLDLNCLGAIVGFLRSLTLCS